MSSRDGRMYVVQRLIRKSNTSMGVEIQFQDGQQAGMLPVYWTKKAAREVYGRNVDLMEIRIPTELG